MLKISCITLGFLGLIVGSVMGYLQMNEGTANKTEAVQVKAAEREDDNHNEDKEM